MSENRRDTRLGNLSDILNSPAPRPRPSLVAPPTPATESAPTDPTTDPAPVVEPAAQPRKPAARRPDTTKRPAATDQTHSRVVLRVAPELHQRLNRFAAEQRLPYSAVVLTAIEQAIATNQLDDLVAPPSSQQPTGLFVGSTTAPVAAGAKTNLELRLHHQDLATLDALVQTHHATSRTDFITRVLDHHLP